MNCHISSQSALHFFTHLFFNTYFQLCNCIFLLSHVHVDVPYHIYLAICLLNITSLVLCECACVCLYLDI